MGLSRRGPSLSVVAVRFSAVGVPASLIFLRSSSWSVRLLGICRGPPAVGRLFGLRFLLFAWPFFGCGCPVAYSVPVGKAPFSGGSPALRLRTDQRQRPEGRGRGQRRMTRTNREEYTIFVAYSVPVGKASFSGGSPALRLQWDAGAAGGHTPAQPATTRRRSRRPHAGAAGDYMPAQPAATRRRSRPPQDTTVALWLRLRSDILAQGRIHAAGDCSTGRASPLVLALLVWRVLGGYNYRIVVFVQPI